MKEKLTDAFAAFKIRRDFTALPVTVRLDRSGLQKPVGLVGWRDGE